MGLGTTQLKGQSEGSGQFICVRVCVRACVDERTGMREEDGVVSVCVFEFQLEGSQEGERIVCMHARA